MSLHFCCLQFLCLMLLTCKLTYSKGSIHSNSSSMFLTRLPLFGLCSLSFKFNKFNLKIWAFLQTLIQYLTFVNNLILFHSKSLFEVAHFPLHSGSRKRKILINFPEQYYYTKWNLYKGPQTQKILQKVVGIFQDKVPLFHKAFHIKGPWLIISDLLYLFLLVITLRS